MVTNYNSYSCHLQFDDKWHDESLQTSLSDIFPGPFCSNVSPKLKFSSSWEHLDLVKPSVRASENLQEDRDAFSAVPASVSCCLPGWETEVLNNTCLLLKHSNI